MAKIPDEYRHLSEARRFEQAQAEFETAARAFSEANRAARAAGQRLTPEMEEKGAHLRTAQERLTEAKADFELVTGGPEPVKSTSLVVTKMRQSFPPEQQAEVVRLLEREIGPNLPFMEDSSTQDLERLRLAVVKLAGGSLAELHHQIDIAKVDWRDVLNSAEYPEASGLRLVEYTRLDDKDRGEIEARDRQQYLAWLHSGRSFFSRLLSFLR